MTAVTSNGRTVIKPTAWKWFTLAAISLALGFVVKELALFYVVAGFCALMGTGITSHIVLSREGFEYRSFSTHKRFRWEEVDGFGIRAIRTNGINSAKMIYFSKVGSENTMYGKFARFMAGGTHSMPVVGMKAEDLLALMMQYQAGHVPSDTPITAKPAAETSTPAASRLRQPVVQAPRPAPMAAPARARLKPGGADPLVADGAGRRRQTNGWPNA